MPLSFDHPAFFWLALGTLLVWSAAVLDMAAHGRKTRFLRDIPPLDGPARPKVSVIVAGRDEERHVEEAARSLLALAYEPLEVIFVDDRSSDRTGEILDRLATEDPRFQVVHVTELPPGWLGKNHALDAGARRATGEFLLFTDADVVMEPTLLARAVRVMVEGDLDHLASGPDTVMPGVVLPAFVGAFLVLFALFTRPWKVRDPRSRAHIGIGAFNLVRAGAYRAVGGHRTIPLRVDDDLKLGKIMKLHRGRSDVLPGTGLMRLEWYASLGELIDGLTKNMFAGLEFRLPAVIGSTAGLLVGMVWPFAAIFLVAGPARWLNAASAALLMGIYAVTGRATNLRPWYAVSLPFGVLLFVYILWRSTILTLWRGGVVWRGTLYPLRELKANRV